MQISPCGAIRSNKFSRLFFTIGLAACVTAFGCGSGKDAPPAGGDGSTALPAIVTQPADHSVPMGLQPVFSVTATGGALHYQWSKNGTSLPGVTTTSYEAPAVAFADTGSTYTVTVSNTFGSVTSQPATLTVTARAPKSGDLRFQQVDALSTLNGYGTTDTYNCEVVPAPGGCTFAESVGLPFAIGTSSCGSIAGGCLWQIQAFNLPTGVSGVSVGYYNDVKSKYPNYLTGTSSSASLTTPDTVITSLNFSPNGGLFYSELPAFGLAYARSDGPGGFDMAQHTVATSALAAAATNEGTEGRVITAITFDTGGVTYLSYGWTQDTGTVYETQTVIAAIGDAPAAVANLAAQGYILTAIGGNDSDGILLVGTRVAGDTMPRIFDNQPVLATQGLAVVGITYQNDSKGNRLSNNILQER